MNRSRRRYCVIVSMALGLALTCSMARSESDNDRLIDPELRKELVSYLRDVCDWVMTLDVGSGTLKNTKDTEWSIFINGNFARVLMAGRRITGNKQYLAEALRWCDTFVGQQQPTVSAHGERAGYWGDRGETGNIYLADSGTAATALAVGFRRADPQRKKRYQEAMERFVRFIHDGCREDPQGQGREASSGWLIREGRNRGALGCGYYRGHLSTAPYTISTAVNGGAFHSAFYAATGDLRLKQTAEGAVRWLLSIAKPNGEIPYIIDGEPPRDDLPLCTLTYCTEAFLAADTHLADPELKRELGRGLKPTVQWLLALQNPDGSWGDARSFDQQRSPSVVSLLAWYWRNVEADPKVAQSVRKYCRFLLDPANSEKYGVKELVRTTGFVGLTVSELLEPGSTF